MTSSKTTIAPATPKIAAWKQAVPIWAGRIIQLAGVWSIVSYLVIPISHRLSWAIASFFELLNLQGQPNLFNGVLLILMGTAVRLRKRIAVWAVILILEIWAPITFLLGVAVSLIFGENIWLLTGSTGTGPHPISTPRFQPSPYATMYWDAAVAVTGVVIIVVLLLARKAFSAKLEKGTWWRALAILGAGVALSTAIGVGLSYATPRIHASLAERFSWAFATALGLKPDDVNVSGEALRGPLSLSFIVTLVSALALFVAVIQFTRSASAKRQMTPDEELAVRELLLTTGDDSLGYFATRRDRSVVFSPDGKAALTFRVLNATALASGDPLGDPDSWRSAIEAFRAQARVYGWTPAIVSASRDGARVFEAAGFRCMLMGDEAIVSADGFSLSGPSMRAVRNEAQHAERAGYRVVVRRQRDIDDIDLLLLGQKVDQWRVGGPERGFSMASGRFGDPSDGSNVIVVAYDETGAPQGILSFVPWGRSGLSLDVMRRDPNSAGGVTEFMVTSLLRACPDFGVRKISLNFAMFRRVFEEGSEPGASISQRTMRKVLRVGSRWWQLESLYRSNEKYHPTWHSRLLCYERGAQFSQVVVAVGQAEGFLPNPAEGLLHRRSHAAIIAEQRSPDFAALVSAQEIAAVQPQAVERRISSQERDRRRRRDRIVAAGMDPYPAQVPRTMTIPELRTAIDTGTFPAEVSVTGRVMRVRDHGGVVFLDLRESSTEVQVMARADNTVHAPGDLTLLRRGVDLGDTISVTGAVVRTHTGDLAIDASTWSMASKSLAPMPDKRKGLADPEMRLRLRHIDLSINTEAQAMVRARAAAVRSIRESFYRRGFIEVETPMLQAIHGGANARPFRTHINAYDADLYLRIAPELALKRLAVGGLEKIFELGRNFRNEGADATHNPEFTSVEAYQAYADYTIMRELTRQIIVEAATAVHGSPVVRAPDGSMLDISGEWPVVTVHDAVSAKVGESVSADTDLATMRRLAAENDVHIADVMTPGEIVAELYDELVEALTTTPTFYTDFPVETSPLTRPHRRQAGLAERWDLVAFGAELGTAYSELIDPSDQRDRLTTQSLKAAAGDPEAMEVDEEFLAALEFGLPPTGGLGLGVDRIVMCIMGASIRQTLAFPFVRPSS